MKIDEGGGGGKVKKKSGKNVFRRFVCEWEYEQGSAKLQAKSQWTSLLPNTSLNNGASGQP